MPRPQQDLANDLHLSYRINQRATDMKTAIACVICTSPIAVSRRGVVAPFLAKRIWQREGFNVDLVRCERCGFQFFNPRLEPAEEERLYVNYRSTEYQRMRRSVEPWYTPTLNENLQSRDYIEIRKQELRKILKPFLSNISNPRILDFGGDRGQLVHGLYLGAELYVYDISKVPLIDGVLPCHSIEECAAKQFDLVICSNALEHVGDPTLIARQLFAISGPDTAVFIEVPFESPHDRKILFRRLAQLGILCFSRPKVALNLWSRGAFCVMHEHVNFFNEQSLDALVRESGGAVVAHGQYPIAGTKANGGTIGWTLGRKTSLPTVVLGVQDRL